MLTIGVAGRKRTKIAKVLFFDKNIFHEVFLDIMFLVDGHNAWFWCLQ